VICVIPVTYVEDMYSSVTSCALVGVEPRPVKIEATVSHSRRGSFTIVGLPDTAVRESRERVRAAIKEQGFRFPAGRVVVNLSPADLPKNGVTFDLPIALSVLAASSEEPLSFERYVCVGELSLRGEVKPVRAALGATLIADQQDKACMLASTSTVAAPMDADLAGIGTLRHAVDVATGRTPPSDVSAPGRSVSEPISDMAAIRGHEMARRAFEIAAAGGHHIVMVGPPGAGKTMLARALPGILPPLQPAELREVALIHAAAGAQDLRSDASPFRAPHHSASIAALVGGGSGIPTPGEVSLAHASITKTHQRLSRSPLLSCWKEQYRPGAFQRHDVSKRRDRIMDRAARRLRMIRTSRRVAEVASVLARATGVSWSGGSRQCLLVGFRRARGLQRRRLIRPLLVQLISTRSQRH